MFCWQYCFDLPASLVFTEITNFLNVNMQLFREFIVAMDSVNLLYQNLSKFVSETSRLAQDWHAGGIPHKSRPGVHGFVCLPSSG
jgi:hypothetical protein